MGDGLTIKIFDTCCLITLFETIKSCNIIQVCESYELIMTSEVKKEFGEASHESISTISIQLLENLSLLDEYKNAFPGVHEGEWTSIELAILLNEKKCGKVVLVMDDNVGKRCINELIQYDGVRKIFPNVDKLRVTGSIGLLKNMVINGKLARCFIKGIIQDLSNGNRWISKDLVNSLSE